MGSEEKQAIGGFVSTNAPLEISSEEEWEAVPVAVLPQEEISPLSAIDSRIVQSPEPKKENDEAGQDRKNSNKINSPSLARLNVLVLRALNAPENDFPR